MDGVYYKCSYRIETDPKSFLNTEFNDTKSELNGRKGWVTDKKGDFVLGPHSVNFLANVMVPFEVLRSLKYRKSDRAVIYSGEAGQLDIDLTGPNPHLHRFDPIETESDYVGEPILLKDIIKDIRERHEVSEVILEDIEPLDCERYSKIDQSIRQSIEEGIPAFP